jgi:hypothetical protein
MPLILQNGFDNQHARRGDCWWLASVHSRASYVDRASCWLLRSRSQEHLPESSSCCCRDSASVRWYRIVWLWIKQAHRWTGSISSFGCLISVRIRIWILKTHTFGTAIYHLKSTTYQVGQDLAFCYETYVRNNATEYRKCHYPCH